MAPGVPRADYGIDAPGVIRNLLVAAAIGLGAWGTAAAGMWSGWVKIAPTESVDIRIQVAPAGLWCGLTCAAMALWMISSSKVGKVKERETLLNWLAWTGDERVLDVGCGRGLMLIGAAKRLTTGAAMGIDIWQAEDLSGNRPESTLENAAREGVADRVRIETADMRKMPFPDGAFDVVVSNAAIHNLYAREDRSKAIREIARVLKPGGMALISDIRHLGEYGATFSESGCVVTSRVGSRLVSLLLAAITFGSLNPATILVKKTA